MRKSILSLGVLLVGGIGLVLYVEWAQMEDSKALAHEARSVALAPRTERPNNLSAEAIRYLSAEELQTFEQEFKSPDEGYLVIPADEANDQRPEKVQTYEYRTLHMDFPNTDEAMLNDLGAEGFDLAFAQVTHAPERCFLIFKRPVQDGEADAAAIILTSDVTNPGPDTAEQPVDETKIDETKVFQLKNVDAFELLTTLSPIFVQPLSYPQVSPRLLMTADRRTNSLIARGSKDELESLEAILLRLDQAANPEDLPFQPSAE